MGLFLAALMMSPLVAVVAWLNVSIAKERLRRRALPPEARQKLEDEERAWSQTYSF
jgi:hypothetical protein